jgi:hypothetical protein
MARWSGSLPDGKFISNKPRWSYRNWTLTIVLQVELPGLALWHRVHYLYPRQPDHIHVWSFPRWLRIRAVAGFHRISHTHLGVGLHRHVHEPRVADRYQNRPILHTGWSGDHDSGLRHHAEQDWQRLCEQLLCVERLAESGRMDQ